MAAGAAADDHRLAAEVAAQAGRRLLEIRYSSPSLPQDQLRAAGDAGSQDLIAALLAERCPGDAVLSEEGEDDSARLDAERVWIIDPLDGTREYAEGRADWAVHVALWAGGDLVAGAVALPGEDQVFATGAELPQRAGWSGPPRLVVSRTRPPAVTEPIRAALTAELVACGSAGAKAMAVVSGRAEVYAHAGGQYEWDSAAPVVVARAAGLHVSRLDGGPLRYNQPDPWLPDLLICVPELADRVLDAAASSA